jgi:DNA-binding HxlR family transcriptional regulator
MPTTTDRPVVLLMDLLGKRWAMRVVWELRQPAASFRELQRRCGDISSSVLWQRVNELKAAALVSSGDERGLALTTAGTELIAAFRPLYDFAARWAASRAADVSVTGGD